MDDIKTPKRSEVTRKKLEELVFDKDTIDADICALGETILGLQYTLPGYEPKDVLYTMEFFANQYNMPKDQILILASQVAEKYNKYNSKKR